MSVTPPLRLLGEALVVGIAFVFIGALVHAVAMRCFGARAMTSHALLAAQAGLAAALFHVIAEYSHLNAMYCRHRSLDGDAEWATK